MNSCFQPEAHGHLLFNKLLNCDRLHRGVNSLHFFHASPGQQLRLCRKCISCRIKVCRDAFHTPRQIAVAVPGSYGENQCFKPHTISMSLKIFITGASSGIGEALAMNYAASGSTVGLVGRRSGMLEELRHRIAKQTSGTAEVYTADVTDPMALKDAAHAFLAQHGLPDGVIACAGVSMPIEPEREDHLFAFNQVLATNTFATFQPFIAAMKKKGRGKLVGIASVAGIRGLSGASAYSASKAAVIALCESMRIELRGSGVEVLTIFPGYVRTAMTAVVPYKQPFLIDADVFATLAVNAIRAGTSYSVIPWQMEWMVWLMKILPNFVYDPIIKKDRNR